MIDKRDLVDAYKTARRNKRRSADSVDYELHAERNLSRLYDALCDRSLTPSAYTFVTMKPRPREVFACEMGMRIIHHYIDIRMRPLIEARLTERTFNNRIGYGPDEAVNQLAEDIFEVSRGFTRDAWVISIDLSGYFPNANQDTAFEQLSRVIVEDYDGPDRDDLLYMLRSAIYSYPASHCYRKSPLWKWDRYITPEKSLFRKPDGIGAAIGHLIWQNGMNYYLNEVDHWIVSELCPHYIRFVDDMYFVTDNKAAFLSWLPEIRRRLAAYGCKVHPRKFYCQHYTKGVNILGSTVKMDRIYPSNRIVRRAFQTVCNLNRCPRPSKLGTFISSVNSYLGIFKRRNAYGIIRDPVDAVSSRWWRMVWYDDARRVIRARQGFTHYEIINRKYNLKFKFTHGKARATQRAGIPAA